MDALKAAAAGLVVFVAACAGGHGASSSSSNTTRASSTVAHVGQLAPAFTEPTTGGGALSLSSLRGKAVYLNFFASWCEPCNDEAPYINDIAKRYAPQGLQVVGVDELENDSSARAFVKKYNLVYPAVIDEGALQTQYEINGLPDHVFIDKRGVVRKIVVGEMSKAEIVAQVVSLLRMQ
jgi:cytochrome c biogenesis protein CcmG/thiol:disulfide interchange protein DsbE